MTSLTVQLILLCLLWHKTTATIQTAAAAGDIAQVQAFLDGGTDVDDLSNGDTALTEAVQNDQYAMVEFLLNATADIDKSRVNGRTPLMLAATNGFYDILVLLVNEGASLDLEAGGKHVSVT
nr:NF-kappa-B inhibitor epsilon-like [Penaeus vannamei]